MTLLPEPELADQPDDLACRHIEAHAVDRLHDAGARHEVGGEVAHLEQRAHRFSLGLSWSRTWSPTRLMATISTISAMPG